MKELFRDITAKPGGIQMSSDISYSSGKLLRWTFSIVLGCNLKGQQKGTSQV